jgi:predicted transcriptional regulator
MERSLIPSIDEVRAALSGLKPWQLENLSKSSTVPLSTLYKIRQGVTGKRGPGIDTVGKFWPLIDAAAKSVEAPKPEKVA